MKVKTFFESIKNEIQFNFCKCAEIIHWRQKYKSIGLGLKSIKVKNNIFEYVEGGTGKTIVLVHGFQGDKNSWFPYIKELTAHYHVICVDLPGHGGSSFIQDMQFDLPSFALSLKQFLEVKNISSFHLAGASMGGGISLVYASMFPEKLLSLTLVNPLGVNFFSKHNQIQELEKVKKIFFPNTIEELDEFGEYLTGRPFVSKRHQKAYLLEKLKRQRTVFLKVFYDLTQTEPLDKILPKIQARTLLLYGHKDKLLHPSSFEVFVKHIPNISKKGFSDGMHVFVDNCLSQAINEIKSFLG